jgi:hypothetical protein
MFTDFWLESLKGKDHLVDLDIDGIIIYSIKIDLRKMRLEVWIRFI